MLPVTDWSEAFSVIAHCSAPTGLLISVRCPSGVVCRPLAPDADTRAYAAPPPIEPASGAVLAADADVTRDDPLGFIMRDMAQNEHLRESGRLAELIQAGMKQVHPGPSRGVKQAGFRVLVTAFMPAVLVEIGFGTNKLEAQYMTDTDRQRELASTLADAVVRYLEQYERKVGGGG